MSLTSLTSQDAQSGSDEPFDKRQTAAERDRRMRRRRRVGISVAAAVAVTAAAIVLSVIGNSPKANLAAAEARMQHMLARIPQHGLTLGNQSAPVTVTEFADLQCPYCDSFTLTLFPTLLTRYVETGKVKMVFETMSFIGSDSVRAGSAALAAGAQNKLWNFVDAFYYNQQAENSGYVTTSFLRAVGSAVPGLDVNRILTGVESAALSQQVKATTASAKAQGIKGTPAFIVHAANDRTVLVLGASRLQDALDQALAS